MAEILIIQNISREGPGLLGEILKSEDITFDVVNLDKGDALPELDGYKALVVLGGPDSANDESVKMKSELEFVRKALDLKIPYLGICLGLQILVKAAGGEVVKGDVKEIGFINTDGNQNTVELTEDGKNDGLLKNLDEKLNVFQLHGETVELTSSMKLLATGKFCENQIVKVASNAYGIQSHFELTSEMLEVWAMQDPDLIPIGKVKLSYDFSLIKESYFDIADSLFKNFLRIAGLIK